MEVLLISPNYTLYKKDVRRCIPPIGLLYIAAFIEEEHNVAVIDSASEGYWNTNETGDYITYGLNDAELRNRVSDFSPDVVGISCIFTTQYENAQHVARIVKEVDDRIKTVMGGSHPTYAPVNDKNIDHIVQHEGELSFAWLLSNMCSPPRIINKGFISDLDLLSFPARHLVDMERYFEINLPQSPYPKGKRVAQLVTSRGCQFSCIFCITTNFWGNQYRTRSARNVIKEIDQLIEDYDIDEVQITDDNFTLDKKRAREIIKHFKGLHWCMPQGVYIPTLDDEMLELMADSGCYQLTFAVESGCQRVLDSIIGKPLKLDTVKDRVEKAKSFGIDVHGFFVCGFPGETIMEMGETYAFARTCGFDSASFFLATPLVGSELFDACRENNYLKGVPGYYKVGSITTPDFTAEEVQELVARFNRSFNEKDRRKKHFDEVKY